MLDNYQSCEATFKMKIDYCCWCVYDWRNTLCCFLLLRDLWNHWAIYKIACLD